MNRVFVMGNLTRDPELKNIGTTNVCNFAIAINRKTQSGNEVTFIEMTAFGKTADNIAKYFTKGKPILIEGRLQLDTWIDSTSKQQRTKLKVVAERFEFCGGNTQQAPQPAAAQQATVSQDISPSVAQGTIQAPVSPFK